MKVTKLVTTVAMAILLLSLSCVEPTETPGTPTPTSIPAPTCTLSGTVFFDYNGNGLRDEGEAALEGVMIHSGESITKSLADGSYLLDNIAQGEIQLEIVKDGFPLVALSLAQVLTADNIPLNITSDIQFNIGLMQGWMTLPFEAEGDALMCNYVDLDYQLGSVRTYSDEHSHPFPTRPMYDNHQGIDWVAEEGTPIQTVGPGVVIEVDGVDPTNGGLHLHILHHFGGRAFVTSYGHYSASTVKLGDKVTRGQIIALVGKTGTDVPHLHFGLWEVPPKFEPGQVREILDYIYRTNKLTVPYASGKEVPAVLDPFRDVIDPQSESFWTVDNSPHYVGGAARPSIKQPIYGQESRLTRDWIIDNEAVVVTSGQPINFVQAYHEQNKITVKNGGYLKIVDSYIRSDYRFLLELHDTSKLIVENSKLIWQGNGAVITNLDSSVVQATDSELDFVGIASGNRPPLYTTVDLSNCSIRQLEIDLFDTASIVVEGMGTGFIQDRTISSERFRMTLKNCNITGEVVSWIGNVEATFRNCNLGQISPDKGSKLNIVKCAIREVVPRVIGYSGLISNLPSGTISSFRLDLPVTQGLSIHIVDSTIENGWYLRYSESNIEFRNCHFSVLKPMGHNYASVYDSTVKEVWVWDTSGEICFYNSPIGWIGNIMNYPGHKNDILLSGDIMVEDEDWRERLRHWGETVIRREFFFLSVSGSGDCVIKDDEGTIIDQFAMGTSATQRVLVFDREQRHFTVYFNDTYSKTLELSSDASVLLP